MTLLVSCTAAGAQERPDLSGTWAAVPDSTTTSTSERAAAPVFGQQFTVDHRGQSFALTRTFAGAGSATINYLLDGSKTTSRVPGRLCEPDSGATWTAAWEGNAIALALVSAVRPNARAMKMDVKSTLKLEAPDTLRVEMAARGADSVAQTTSTVYKRTASQAPPAAAPSRKAKATLTEVAWIAGTWTGTSPSGETTFEERWTPPAGGSMLATSRTLRDGALSAFEFLCIVERDGGLVYQAMPNGRFPATDFTLTTIDANNAVFENPDHDFPKKIHYTKRPDGSLEAVASGDASSKPQRFIFKRQE
jgi:hypothetical protein